MKVHAKYKPTIILQTNEEMCTDLVMGLLDNALEKNDTHTDLITVRNEDLSDERRGLKRTFDDINQNSIDIQSLRKSIIKDELGYKQKIELGREVYIFINEAKILQESLSKERQEALDLYIKQKQRLDQDNTKLRPWQGSLLEYIKPTDREVIWVRGINGNEGKTWFQQFLKERYGWSKAVTGMDIKAKDLL